MKVYLELYDQMLGLKRVVSGLGRGEDGDALNWDKKYFKYEEWEFHSDQST